MAMLECGMKDWSSEGTARQRCVQQEVFSEREARREAAIAFHQWCVQTLTNGCQSW